MRKLSIVACMVASSFISFSANAADFQAAFDSYKAHMNDSQSADEFSRLGFPSNLKSDVDGSINAGHSADEIARIFHDSFVPSALAVVDAAPHLDSNVNEQQQHAAQQAALREKFNALKGVAMTEANQSRTSAQTQALKDSQKAVFQQLKTIDHAGVKGSESLVAQSTGDNATPSQMKTATVVNQQPTHTKAIAVNSMLINANTLAIRNAEMQQANRDRTANQHVTAQPEPASESTEAAKQPASFNAPEAETIRVDNELIDAHNENVEAIASNSQHIDGVERSTNQRFADMGKRVDDNRKRAAVGVAGVAAMANIPQVTESQSFSVGAGVGDYDTQQAVAVGFSARVSQHIITKAAVSAGSFGGAAVGAGLSYGW